MKKILLSLFAVSACIFTATGQRVTLHEEFTGENCPPCASTNPSFWALCDLTANKPNLIHITYMAPIPSSGPYYVETQPMTDPRTSYYAVPFAPYGRYDGHIPDPGATYPGHPGYFTQSDIDAEVAVAAPITITATHHFNAAHDSVFGKVTIHGVTAASGTLKLRAAFTKTMNFASPPGTNGETDFENVVRTMFPDVNGQTVTSPIAAGSTTIYTYKGKISGLETNTSLTFTQVDSGFVVWVQNDADKTVLQAARSTYNPGYLGVNEPSMSIGLNVYPNPAQESTNVTFTLAQAGSVEVSVVDELGRTVYSAPAQTLNAGSQSINISTGNLASGIYSVMVKANGETTTQKLSVTK